MKHIGYLLCVLAAYVSTMSETVGADRLPASLDKTKSAIAENATWSVRDIVEIRRIKGIAVSDTSRDVAFILEQASVEANDIRYGLYIVDGQRHSSKKVVEASFIDQVSWHPNSDLWTIRADFGEGVQLYDVGSDGSPHPLAVNKKTLMTGGGR